MISYPFRDLGFTDDEIEELKKQLEDGLTAYIEEPRPLVKLYTCLILANGEKHKKSKE